MCVSAKLDNKNFKINQTTDEFNHDNMIIKIYFILSV